MVQFNEDKEIKKLAELRRNEEEELAQILAQKYGIDYINLTGTSINTDALRLIPEVDSREGNVIAWSVVGKRLSIAALSPESDKTRAVLQNLVDHGYNLVTYICSRQSLEKAWERYKDISFASETKGGSLDISSEEIEQFIGQVHSMAEIKAAISDTLSMKKSYRISRLLVIIMAGALSVGSSDIHIEPEEAFSRIRYRLDGVLQDVIEFDTETYNLILSRVKLLSNLKLNVKDNAQDGRFSVKIYQEDIEIRTSVLPGAYGESIVLRVLNPKSLSVSLEEMGIPKNLFDILMREIDKPQGMILTTGPTGSGKTTTLYSFLHKVQSPEIKIITIEDPIEYHLPGITQTQVDVKKGYTFDNGLRSALRQDPDVIMVGEIRDQETASTAIEASLTGHLVFSTLHTNSAAGAFTRLMDLGVNPRILPSAVMVAIAQRLVRRLCPTCKKRVAIPPHHKLQIDQIINSIVNKSVDNDLARNALDTNFMYEADGCSACNHTGYKGRVGIFEAILADNAIEQLVREMPSEREIEAAAAPQGIMTMRQDGILKVLKGVTSLTELQRVVDIY